MVAVTYLLADWLHLIPVYKCAPVICNNITLNFLDMFYLSNNLGTIHHCIVHFYSVWCKMHSLCCESCNEISLYPKFFDTVLSKRNVQLHKNMYKIKRILVHVTRNAIKLAWKLNINLYNDNAFFNVISQQSIQKFTFSILYRS